MNAVVMPEYLDTLEGDELAITPAAREQLAKLFQESRQEYDDVEAIRVYVAGGGCTGMTYGMTFTDRQTEYDKVWEDNGFKVYVDAVALSYLNGVEIDYVNRPMGASFVFNNVFAATGGSGTCGACGAATGAGGGCG